MEEMQSNQIPTFLPRNFDTASAVPKKLVSSFIALVRPLDSPKSPPWMVLSVEPSKGVTQLYNPLTRTPVQNLDLTKFRTTILATECHIVDDDNGYGLFCSGSSIYVKALMFFIPPAPVPSIENCCVYAIFDDGQVRVSHPFDRRHAYFHKALDRLDQFTIDDIIIYKGNVYVIDKFEQLFSRSKRVKVCLHCKKEFHFCPILVRKNTDYRHRNIRRRKRLVVSSSGETLYMADLIDIGHGKRPSGAIGLYLKFYELDSTNNSWCLVSSFEDVGVDQVLFVTRDYCFFVAASEFPGCQLRNCIIFSDDAFPVYSTSEGGWDYPSKGGHEIAIFSLDKDHEYSLPIKSYPGFPVMLWSPPPWILRNASSPSQSRSQSEPEKDRMEQSASDNKYGASLQEDALSTIVQSDSLGCLAQPAIDKVVTLKKFQGIDVLPDHLPVLENVWMKHGNVFEGVAICSSDIKSMALASLAKILLILETNNGHILAKDQAQYLGSTFSDLQYMHLKVDWLAPSVKKALATYKRKQLMELDKPEDKAAEEVERKFLSEMDNYMRPRLDKGMPKSDRLYFLVCFFIAFLLQLSLILLLVRVL